jgi:hypothetical protein
VGNLVQVTNEIFTFPGLFTDHECDEWIALSESMGFEPAPINTNMGPQRYAEVRNNDRVLLDDATRARELWQRIAKDIPPVVERWKPVGLNERMRFYRYDPGQRFKWHGDGCFRRANGEQSFLTFMVYLNDGFTGGETVFRGVQIEPQQGMALLFCHWQKHMGAEVRVGRKYVLRSDVMFAKSGVEVTR